MRREVLPDFSFAGYGRGERGIPEVPVVASVKEFGAVGDGRVDDTEAFRRGIAAVSGGALTVPRGRYVIEDVLEIGKSNVVLRGEGEGSRLYFPKALNEVWPDWGATTGGRRTSNYSWSGGFLWVKGKWGGRELAKVIKPARRGDVVIEVSSAGEIQVGQMIEIRVEDDVQNSLAGHLYDGDAGDVSELKGSTKAEITVRVLEKEGNVLRIDRGLRFDLREEWRARVVAFEPEVREVGIEGLCFEFPDGEYGGHFTELGQNAIAMEGAADCWVRDVVIENCDSGVFGGGRFCTFDGITYRSTRKVDGQFGATGHHGVYLEGDDNLFTRFGFETKFIHDLTVSRCAGNVFSRGRGVDVCFDHHKRAPHVNLFSDIDVGEGSRVWACGGGEALGRHCAYGEVFWNIRGKREIERPIEGFGPGSIYLRMKEEGDLYEQQLH